MRKLLIGAAFAAAFSLPASAADPRDVTIVNETGYEIAFIGVNPPGDSDFGGNELSSGLADGTPSRTPRCVETNSRSSGQTKVDREHRRARAGRPFA